MKSNSVIHHVLPETINWWRRGGDWSIHRKPMTTSCRPKLPAAAETLTHWWQNYVVACLFLGCFMSQQHAKYISGTDLLRQVYVLPHWDSTLVYLADRSAQTIVHAATSRQKLQIPLASSPSHGQPALTLHTLPQGHKAVLVTVVLPGKERANSC